MIPESHDSRSARTTPRLRVLAIASRVGHWVVSTGAAPGYVAIAIGRRFGARTLWLDSIANVEQLSLSGERAIRHADLVLTQWPHLAREGQVEYRGSVL